MRFNDSHFNLKLEYLAKGRKYLFLECSMVLNLELINMLEQLENILYPHKLAEYVMVRDRDGDFICCSFAVDIPFELVIYNRFTFYTVSNEAIVSSIVEFNETLEDAFLRSTNVIKEMTAGKYLTNRLTLVKVLIGEI
jgi:hypothetical protein